VSYKRLSAASDTSEVETVAELRAGPCFAKIRVNMPHVDLMRSAVLDHIMEGPDSWVLMVWFQDDWDDSERQLGYVRAKIENYARFVVDGELVKQFPRARGRVVRIELFCGAEPTPAVRELLEIARPQLSKLGIGLSVRLMPRDIRDGLINAP
jgi:hypothetical protein